jgi:YEATS family
MVRNRTILVLLLLIGSSLCAADQDVSIASVAVGAAKPWQWTVFIKGTSDALAHVTCVQYVLDPSFPNPYRTVCNRGTEDQSFPTSGTTWGPFNLSATVTFDDKTVQHLQYTLNPDNAQSQPTRWREKGWQPVDLTSNPSSELFALDRSGGVSRLVIDQGSPRIEELFRLKATDSGTALTANAESVFVASNSDLGCTVYKYSVTSKKAVRRLVAAKEKCLGIAIDGTGGFYLTVPARKEIRHFDRWDTGLPHRWNPNIDLPTVLVFDNIANRVIVADVSGNAYAISIPDGKEQLLSTNLGAVTSIATSRFHIMLASGKKVLFLGRSDNHGENPPPGLQSLTGGQIKGVAVDVSDRLWFADEDNNLVEGPFPLS